MIALTDETFMRAIEAIDPLLKEIEHTGYDDDKQEGQQTFPYDDLSYLQIAERFRPVVGFNVSAPRGRGVAAALRRLNEARRTVFLILTESARREIAAGIEPEEEAGKRQDHNIGKKPYAMTETVIKMTNHWPSINGSIEIKRHGEDFLLIYDWEADTEWKHYSTYPEARAEAGRLWAGGDIGKIIDHVAQEAGEAAFRAQQVYTIIQRALEEADIPCPTDEPCFEVVVRPVATAA